VYAELTKTHSFRLFFWRFGPLGNWTRSTYLQCRLFCFVFKAAVSYRVFRSSPKFTIKLVHAGLHILAFLFAVIGLFAVFGFHNHQNIPNFYSLHGWIGFVTVIAFGSQVGFLFFDFKLSDLIYISH